MCNLHAIRHWASVARAGTTRGLVTNKVTRFKVTRFRSIAPNVKWVHFVRHAESNWNCSTQGEHVGAHPGLVDMDSDVSPHRGAMQLSQLQTRLTRGTRHALVPPPTLIITSPLTRAIRTAIALSGTSGIPVVAEPLLTEWLENSCDVGRPGAVLHREFGDGSAGACAVMGGYPDGGTATAAGRGRGTDAATVSGLAALGDGWWPRLPTAAGNEQVSTLAALARGDRELESSVDARCAAMLDALHDPERHPAPSVAIVAHCMILQKLQIKLMERQMGGIILAVDYLGNTEHRSYCIQTATAAPRRY